MAVGRWLGAVASVEGVGAWTDGEKWGGEINPDKRAPVTMVLKAVYGG